MQKFSFSSQSSEAELYVVSLCHQIIYTWNRNNEAIVPAGLPSDECQSAQKQGAQKLSIKCSRLKTNQDLLNYHLVYTSMLSMILLRVTTLTSKRIQFKIFKTITHINPIHTKIHPETMESMCDNFFLQNSRSKQKTKLKQKKQKPNN